MGPLSYMRSVVDRNVVMRRIGSPVQFILMVPLKWNLAIVEKEHGRSLVFF